MYIAKTYCGGGRGGEQFARRGLFLILLQREDQAGALRAELRAIVRKVALRQFGPWMMGAARVKGHRVGVCGAYGSNGLPVTVPDEVYEEGVPLPVVLVEAWNKGEGHNGPGNEAEQMRAWALLNLDRSYKV